MKRPSLCPFFFTALFFMIFSTALFPNCRLVPFAPFLNLAFNQCSFPKALYLASACGLITDFFSNQILFGHHALIYVITACCVYKLRLFFPEKPLGLSLFTLFFSLIVTTIERFAPLFFEVGVPLTWEGVATDFFVMPFFDGVYAFLFFSCPLIFYKSLRRQWFRFLFFIKRATKGKNKPRGRSFDR